MLYALVAAFTIALCSLSGIIFLSQSGRITGTHRFVIPFAIGIFLGVIFFELIPETLEGGGTWGSVAIVGGFLAFYLLAHLLRHYHHHCHDCDEHHASNASLILIGDAVHNLADGIVIFTAFLINPAVGIATTIAIALHEIPQELAEYGILRSTGLSHTRALSYNFLSALTVVGGVLLAALFAEAGNLIFILTGFAAGNLLYIAASDLIPELSGDEHRHHFGSVFLSMVIGLVAIVGLLTWSHEYFGEAHLHDHEEEHADHDLEHEAGDVETDTHAGDEE